MNLFPFRNPAQTGQDRHSPPAPGVNCLHSPWAFLLPCAILLLSILPGWTANKNAKLQTELSAFIENRARLAATLADKENQALPDVVRDYFRAAQKGDFITASNHYEKFQVMSTNSNTEDLLRRELYTVRQPMLETFGTWEIYRDWNPKFLTLFGESVIKSLPKDALYFGGTDPGRFIITTMAEARKPFVTLTQNQLADGTYLTYLTSVLGDKIYTPSHEDSQKCFQDYLSDAQKRAQHDQKFPDEPRQIKPGEDIRIVENRVQVSGQVAVMAINGLLVKIIFDNNPERDFYIEESFPLDWMNAYLTPHGFIFKLNRKPLQELPNEVIRTDTAFWNSHTKAWLGNWLTSETSVRQVVDFVNTIYVKEDLKAFKGDKQFLKALEARKAFSKMRSAVAGIYAWRAETARNSEQKQRMIQEAELAFKQAFAICPVSPEALFRYDNLLVSLGRNGDAMLLTETALKLFPDNEPTQNLLRELKKAPKQNQTRKSSDVQL